MINKLHFISNQTDQLSHLDSIALALQAGCRLIQLRIKNQPLDEVLKLAEEAQKLCQPLNARLVINDYPEVAREIKAFGLHLGLDDMPIADARKIVGNKVIIGGTANTLENVLSRIKEGADYVGIGPLRFTKTKKNLSPVLGFDGYRSIVEKLKKQKLDIPLIAIGGIIQNDIAILKEIGIHGVAVSGSITEAEDPLSLIAFINKTLC